MKLNLDLPPSSWNKLKEVLKPHIEESESIEKIYYAIESLNFKESFEAELFKILSASAQNPINWAEQSLIEKCPGGPSLIRRLNKANVKWPSFRKSYFDYLQNNFKLTIKD